MGRKPSYARPADGYPDAPRQRRGMQIKCPACGSYRVRSSRSRGVLEKIGKYFGLVPVRCKECETRFHKSLWEVATWCYARCPRCYKMELGNWSEEYYIAPKAMRFLIRIGAKRLRCEPCRFNFVSFRLRKHATGRKWRDIDVSRPPAAERRHDSATIA